jgi:hypothetical protein
MIEALSQESRTSLTEDSNIITHLQKSETSLGEPSVDYRPLIKRSSEHSKGSPKSQRKRRNQPQKRKRLNTGSGRLSGWTTLALVEEPRLSIFRTTGSCDIKIIGNGSPRCRKGPKVGIVDPAGCGAFFFCARPLGANCWSYSQCRKMQKSPLSSYPERSPIYVTALVSPWK